KALHSHRAGRIRPECIVQATGSLAVLPVWNRPFPVPTLRSPRYVPPIRPVLPACGLRRHPIPPSLLPLPPRALLLPSVLRGFFPENEGVAWAAPALKSFL